MNQFLTFSKLKRFAIFFLIVCLFFPGFIVASCSAQSWWETSGENIAREALDFNQSKLNKVDDTIQKEFKNIYSLIIIKNGQLVFEKYYPPGTATNASIIHSVTKSITSILIGIALDMKLIKSLDQSVVEFLPEYFEEDKRS